MLIIHDYFPSGLACINGVITISPSDIWQKNVFRKALPPREVADRGEGKHMFPIFPRQKNVFTILYRIAIVNDQD